MTHPVTIYKAVSGCGGCVEVSNFQQKTIEPGKTISISATLVTKETIGQVRKAVLISYGSWYKQSLVVYLEALITPSLEKNHAPSEQSNSSD
ncbi:hypothetical protein FACS1894170_06960 [Planctomycetales bacterium]|nr:hypothetical protein FACS1894170_06960 [Planctomycetales bacterium]